MQALQLIKHFCFNAFVEYGTEGIVSTSGDVYSYGAILLEMFTKKKPTDDMFGEGLNSKHWVKESIHRNSIMEVVDSSLISEDSEHFPAEEECVSSVLRLAIGCLADSPQERINMREIVARLQKIKTVLLKTVEKSTN
jgi:LRR receptor-like serine/threonine-protein kinase FLS2